MPEVADILRRDGRDYQVRFGDDLLPSHRRAALVGVAPLNRDRGTLPGSRTIWIGAAQFNLSLGGMTKRVAARRKYRRLIRSFADV
jgi:hypothetical protein